MENIFESPPMVVIKYYNFLEVKPKYSLTEVRESILSFVPGPEWMNKMTMLGKSTDYLHSGQSNEVDMVVMYETFEETIKKAETARFMAQFMKVVEWSLQTKEM
jgi:hypothetical protein